MENAWIALRLTLKVAGWATVLNLAFGVAIGFLLARKRFPGRDLLDALLTLPLVMPPTVLGYYLLVLLGRHGPIGGWLQESFGINLIFTWQGAVIAATIVA
ncbi:MAG: molybdate ABC transporter permease subunit, partial [Gammaproteobacteria bacterium]